MSILQSAKAKQARVCMLVKFARELGVDAKTPSKAGSLFMRKKTMQKIEMGIAQMAHVHHGEILAFAISPNLLQGGKSVRYSFGAKAQLLIAKEVFTRLRDYPYILTPEEKSSLALRFLDVFHDGKAADYFACAIVPEDALAAQRKLRYGTSLKGDTRAEMRLAKKMPQSDVQAALEYSMQEDVQAYLATRLLALSELAAALKNPTLAPKVAYNVIVPRLQELSANLEAELSAANTRVRDLTYKLQSVLSVRQ